MDEVAAGPRGGAGDRLLQALSDGFWDILAHAPGGIVAVDRQGVISWTNEEMARITGRPLETLIGSSLGLVLDPEERVESLLGVAVPPRGMTRVSSRVRRPDGSVRLLVCDVWEVREGDEALGRFLVIIDETERLEAEARLVARETRYVDVFDNAPVGLAIVSPSGFFIEANAAYHDILDYPHGSLRGRRTSEVTIAEDQPASADRMARMVAGELDGYRLEKRYRRRDGTPVWTELHVSAVRGEAGELRFFVGLINDISRRKQAEVDQARMRRELEERNADLQNFASVASHDLKAPLQNVTGFLEMLVLTVGDALDQTARGYVERAMSGTLRMAELIDAMLAFARSGTNALEPVDVEVEDVLAAIVGRLRSSIDAVDEGVEIDCRDLGIVHADPAALEIVLQNLLVNAVTYRRGGVPLRIVVETRPAYGVTELRVSDNGRGIAPEEREKVFGMFDRGAGVGKGSGIGLATVARLVDRHGGSVHVEDGIAGGVTLVVRWPQGDA